LKGLLCKYGDVFSIEEVERLFKGANRNLLEFEVELFSKTKAILDWNMDSQKYKS